MKRIFKFRNWSLSKKEWIDVSPNMAFQEAFEISLCDDCISQQFTGLLDKNGKEICEGDFIIINAEPRLVEWGAQTGSWCYRGSSFDHPLFQYDLGDIIGNVFENPELLK